MIFLDMIKSEDLHFYLIERKKKGIIMSDMFMKVTCAGGNLELMRLTWECWFPRMSFPTGYYCNSSGVGFHVKTFSLPTTARGTLNVRVQAWMINSHDSRFRTVHHLYHRGGLASILIFDVHRQESIRGLPLQVECFYNQSRVSNPPIFLLGYDMHHQDPVVVSRCVEDAWPMLESTIQYLETRYPSVDFYWEVHGPRDNTAVENMLRRLASIVVERAVNHQFITKEVNDVDPCFPQQEPVTNDEEQNDQVADVIHEALNELATMDLEDHASVDETVTSRNVTFLKSVPTRLGIPANGNESPQRGQVKIVMLETMPLYRCVLHWSSFAKSRFQHEELNGSWHQCQVCDAFLCSECYLLVQQHYQGFCPNLSWPTPHQFVSKNKGTQA